jgi:hypothetical protein
MGGGAGALAQLAQALRKATFYFSRRKLVPEKRRLPTLGADASAIHRLEYRRIPQVWQCASLEKARAAPQRVRAGERTSRALFCEFQTMRNVGP